jgi:hypothetical protein
MTFGAMLVGGKDPYMTFLTVHVDAGRLVP